MPPTSRTPHSRPLYSQIRELLIGRMLSGDWRPGHMLPSEFKIAEEYGVSQGTVRKAIEDMEVDRLVVRRQGKGTFVIARALPATHFQFFRIASDNGGKLLPSVNRTLFIRKEAATAAEIKALELKRDAQVYRFHRVRSFNNVPALLEQITLPETIFPNFDELYRADPQPHVYVFIERKYGVVSMRAEEQLRAVAATEDEATALSLKPGTPLLRIDRVGYGIGDKPFEMRVLLCHTVAHHYKNTISIT